MSRYINAEKILPYISRLFGAMPLAVLKMVEMDSIDIVMCKECRHWNGEDHWCNIRDSYGWDYKPDDFCSYGEREDD